MVWDCKTNQGATLSFLGPGILEILDALPFYVLLVDKDHRILLANKATRDVLELEPDEIVGEFCPKVVHGVEEGSYPGCPLEEVVKTGHPVEHEHYDEEKGRWLKVAIYPTSAWTVSGDQIFFHMIEDITEQKLAKDTLAASEEKYRNLFEGLIEGQK